MNPCSPSWLPIKLTLYSASVGGGVAASHLASNCGQAFEERPIPLRQPCVGFHVRKARNTVSSDCVAAPRNLKSP
jgi:hypothetical protein